MAQLVPVYDPLTKTYVIIDVDRNVSVASFANKSIADSFAAAGDNSATARQQAQVQDVNTSGGVQTPAKDTSTSNPPDPQVPAPTTSTVPASSIDTSATVPVYTSRTSSGGITYASVDPEVSATLKAQALAANPAATGSTFVKDANYEGGGYWAPTYSKIDTAPAPTNAGTVATTVTPSKAEVVTKAADTNFGTTTQTLPSGTTIQTTDSGSVTTTPAGSVNTTAVAEDPQALARAGLTQEQLTLLGGADATDPYIRARLDLPPLSEQKTLSGAIGSLFTPADDPTAGGAFVEQADGSFVAAEDLPAASEVDTKPAEVVPGAGTGSVAYGADGELLPGYQLNETNDPVYVGGNADTPVQTQADTTVPVTAEEGYYQQFVAAFQQEQDAPTATDSPYAPVAAVGDTPLVDTNSTVTVEAAPAEFDNAQPIAVKPDEYTAEELNTIADAQGVAGEEGNITADSLAKPPGDYNPDELNAIADAQGVAGEEGNITADSLSKPPGEYTADELNAIADAQGVAGEEGNITSDSLSKEPGAYTADELNAIAEAQGVAGEEGNITADSLAKEPGAYSAAELDAIAAAQGVDAGDTPTGGVTDQQLFDNEAATSAANAKDRANQQQTLKQQQALQQTSNDWRVKLSLAKNADYLYNAANPGILKPLDSKTGTSGVVFPYTPTINTNYRADYSPYTLTHSNYKGYFYNSSYMDAVNITATFTAQDTVEAEYLLAVIHFFRSVTKMFYGQDTQRGSPPPLVYLSGLGEYQFNKHPCVVSQFTYNLPADVDYIRATSIVNQGISFNNTRSNQSSPVSGLAGVSRLANALLPKGAKASPPAPANLGKNSSTYVPTKMEIAITLLPVQSRNQVSKVFKLSEYASGNQLKGGFW